jgi:hypothetical protein
MGRFVLRRLLAAIALIYTSNASSLKRLLAVRDRGQFRPTSSLQTMILYFATRRGQTNQAQTQAHKCGG